MRFLRPVLTINIIKGKLFPRCGQSATIGQEQNNVAKWICRKWSVDSNFMTFLPIDMYFPSDVQRENVMHASHS